MEQQIHSHPARFDPLSPSASPSAACEDVKAEAMESLTKLVRNRRNVPVLAVPQFKRLPDFWGWYKYFMDTHNQEGVSANCFPLN